MVVREGEMNWQQGEVESLQREGEEATRNDVNNVISSSLGRQSSSIYSLTLDEFQHSLCDSGKNFGSMNMDEFLSSIWNAEENQQQAASNNNNSNNNNLSAAQKGISKQASLPRQNSLSIPAPLCRKTVEQVWSEIHKEQQNHHNINNVAQNTESTPRQPTFGEMTLEDFLVKAGVVREQQSGMPVAIAPPPTAAAVSSHRPQQHYAAVYPNNNSTMVQAASFAIGGGGNLNVVAPPYQTVAQGGGAVGEPSSSGYVGNGKTRDSIGTGYPPPPPAVCYGGRVVNGAAGGYGMAVAQTMGMGGPVSPVSSDGIGNENSGGQFGIDMNGLRGRKRMVDGPVERVVERRQRRMIKNRESAARSRARKQVPEILTNHIILKSKIMYPQMYELFEILMYI